MTGTWTASDLLIATGGAMSRRFAATGVSIDTRTLREGDLFVALRGENGDGHDHVADAARRGAAGALVHRAVGSDAATLLVADTLAGLGRLGSFARARFRGRLAAITGSVGKTTTKEMLRRILAATAPTHAATASYNNHWGVPLTLARLPEDVNFCIAEIGMNHAGEIAPLARLARPHVAVITSIAAAHIGNLGSIAAIADEKASIMAGLEQGGVAVLPADSPLLPRLAAAAGTARRITFGASPAADARLVAANGDAAGVRLRATVLGESVEVTLGAPGQHMALNAVAALAAAAALGVAPKAAAAALSGFAPVAGRGARRSIAVADGSALLLDESYNASGASVRAALAVLTLQPARRRIVVLGDMLELGEHGPAEHASLAPDVVAAADAVFACGPLMHGLFEALPASLRAGHATDSAALAPMVAAFVREGDAILVKGSLGSRMKTVVNALAARAEAA